MNTSDRAASIADDPRWNAVLARDPRADGRFVYSVATTGVYCRPSCPSRRAKPENVRFHASGSEAVRAGFRPCARCRPDEPTLGQRHAAIVAKTCRAIDAATEPLPLAELARQAALSPCYLHRIFKQVTGLTPGAYAAARRAQRVQEELTRADRVTDAIHDAGYGSSGRFYADARQVLGMTPTAWRDGGRDAEIRFAIGQCSLGAILVAESRIGLCAIALGDDPDVLARDLQDRFPSATLVGDDPAFANRIARVVALVEAPRVGLDLPLDIRGTAFQRRVWQALRDLPAGRTVTYGELARSLGMPQAVRAVAGACAANSLAVAIPCHRVVRQDGSLSGYRWGVERKRALIDREADD